MVRAGNKSKSKVEFTKKKKANELKKKPLCKKKHDNADTEFTRHITQLVEQERENFAQCLRMQDKMFKDTTAHILSLGFVFSPSDGQLVDYYLRLKCLGISIRYCPIEEVNVDAHSLQDLAGKSQVSYFFTRGHLNEVQQVWIPAEKADIFYKDVKVGVKQVFDYCDGHCKTKLKIIEYQLDPAPDNLKNGLWFIWKLCNDADCVNVHSGP